MRIGKIAFLPLIAMIVVSIDNIRNLPAVAIYGDQIIELYLLVGLCFFIPCGLVTMSFAMSFIENEGGIYTWVSRAFGKKVGFLAIWLQWIENVVWFPSIVAFIAAAFGHMFYLKLNALEITLSVTIIFWLTTWINLKGIELTSKISLICTILGLLLPLACLVLFNYLWYQSGFKFYNTEILNNIFSIQPFSNLDYSAISVMCLSLAGLEITSVHVTNVVNPQKNYSLAILVAMFIIITSLIIGSFSILALMPIDQIDLIDSIFDIFSEFLNKLHFSILEPLFALMILLGSFGGLINWIIAPIRGLQVSAKDGFLPSMCLIENEYQMPSFMLILQAVLVSILSCLFLFFDTTNQGYWVLTVIPAGLYLLMYILFFMAYIKLSVSKSLLIFKSKLYNNLIFVSAVVGLLFSIFAEFTILKPPSSIFGGTALIYAVGMLLSLFFFIAPAFFCMISNNDKC